MASILAVMASVLAVAGGDGMDSILAVAGGGDGMALGLVDLVLAGLVDLVLVGLDGVGDGSVPWKICS